MTVPAASSRPGGHGGARGVAAALAILIVGAVAAAIATWAVTGGETCADGRPAGTPATGFLDPLGGATTSATSPNAPSSPPADTGNTSGTGGVNPAPACVKHSGLPGAAVTLAGVLLFGGAALLVSGGRERGSSAADPRSVPSAAAPTDTDRVALTSALIYAIDRLPDSAVTTRLAEALNAVGVTTVGAVGERFDPSLHEAVAAVPAQEADVDGTVAEVDRVGYSDAMTLLRPAQVTVFRNRA